MFSVERRVQDGEFWGHCDLSANFVSGKDCTHCTESKHVQRVRGQIKRRLVPECRVDPIYEPPDDQEPEVARASP
eukprot:3384443-Lingulodinium_polyedra.AAC.1